MVTSRNYDFSSCTFLCEDVKYLTQFDFTGANDHFSTVISLRSQLIDHLSPSFAILYLIVGENISHYILVTDQSDRCVIIQTINQFYIHYPQNICLNL